MERIEDREIALTRHAESVLHAVDAQLVDQDLRGGPHVILGAHEVSLAGDLPCPLVRAGAGRSVEDCII